MASNGTEPVQAHEQQSLAMNVNAETQIVEFVSRGRFDIASHTTLVPFDAIEAAYYYVLALRMQAKFSTGQISSQVNQPGAPVAHGSGVLPFKPN